MEESVRVFVRLRPAVVEAPGACRSPRARSATKQPGSARGGWSSVRKLGSVERVDSAPFRKEAGDLLLNARTGEALGFDGVFGPAEDNNAVFAEVVRPRLPALLQGTSVAVFMYGQTNSGKTYTMKGETQPGLLQTSLRALFALLETQSALLYRARLSYVEVYSEKVFDLLGEGGALEPRDRDGAMQLGAKEVLVASEEIALKTWAEGERRRHFAATTANYRSSRSHVLLTLSLEVRERGKLAEPRRAQLLLADLAGSENAARQVSDPARFKEGTVINKSLLALSSLIMRLRAGREGVSFRESKLTRLLQNSLGGNCLTAVVCTLSPDTDSYAESLSTLRFALGVGALKTAPRPASQASEAVAAVSGEELAAAVARAETAIAEKEALERRVEALAARATAAETELLSIRQLVASLEAVNRELTEGNAELAKALELLGRREPNSERAVRSPFVQSDSARVTELERQLRAAESQNREFQSQLRLFAAFQPSTTTDAPIAKRLNNSPTKPELRRWNAELRRKLARAESEAEERAGEARRLRDAIATGEAARRQLAARIPLSPINGEED